MFSQFNRASEDREHLGITKIPDKLIWQWTLVAQWPENGISGDRRRYDKEKCIILKRRGGEKEVREVFDSVILQIMSDKIKARNDKAMNSDLFQ